MATFSGLPRQLQERLQHVTEIAATRALALYVLFRR